MKSLKSIKNWTLTKSLKNNNFSFKRNYVLRFVPSLLLTNAFKSISSWKNYKATPLLKLDKLQKDLKLNNVFYKDESKRFHLKSFKALGGAYAVEKISKGKKNIIVSSATAGNHGRSVAWGAKRLGLKCKIFVIRVHFSNKKIIIFYFFCVRKCRVKNKKLGNDCKVVPISMIRVIIGSFGLFLIGFLNGFLSSGTGLFVTIWIISTFNLSFSVAVAYTLILVGIFWNAIGAIALGLYGNINWNYIPILILSSVIGGYFGASFSIIKGSKFIKIVFEIVSFSVGISLLLKIFLR